MGAQSSSGLESWDRKVTVSLQVGMYVCMCVCLHVICACVGVHVCMYVCVSACMHVHMCVRTCLCVYVAMLNPTSAEKTHSAVSKNGGLAEDSRIMKEAASGCGHRALSLGPEGLCRPRHQQQVRGASAWHMASWGCGSSSRSGAE